MQEMLAEKVLLRQKVQQVLLQQVVQPNPPYLRLCWERHCLRWGLSL